MTVTELYDQCRSAVLHIVFVQAGRCLASGTAFTALGRVITNNHVFAGPNDAQVVIRAHDSDPDDVYDGVTLTGDDFRGRLVSGSDEDHHDYAILDIPEIIERGGFDLTFGNPDDVVVGQEIVFLGYPFEHLNLVCHAGIVSSRYQSGGVDIIQLDASINQSNSGGPLLERSSGSVVGIITRKATGLTNQFDHLNQVFDQNIAELQKPRATMSIGGVDPVQALIVGQNQMKQLAREIQRSANVGIGYAFSIEHVAADAALLSP